MHFSASFDALIALFTQAVLYGLYLATLVLCLRALLYSDEGWNLKPWKDINLRLLITTILIFSLSTTNLGLSLLSQLYFLTGGTDPRFIWTISLNIVNGVAEYAVILIVDAVLIYRCWVVYGQSWRIIFIPSLFWIGAFISSNLSIYYANANDSDYAETASILYSCNIATNVYATCAIIYHILSVARSSIGSNGKHLKSTVRILAESGILYSSMTVFALIAIALAHALYSRHPVIGLVAVLSDSINYSMAGITFNLILIRVYNTRVDKMNEDSETADERALSQLRFQPPQPTETSSSDNGSKDVISEVRRSEEVTDNHRAHEN